MKLFHKYQSRSFQFALELLARLEHSGSLTERQLQQLARDNGLDYAGQVVQPLIRAGLLEREGRGCRLAEGVRAPHLPPGRIELDYLRYILARPEAGLFLDEDTRRRLDEAGGDAGFFGPVQCFAPPGEELPRTPGPEGFQTLLSAIRRRYMIRYRFRTRDDGTPRPGRALPWKLEYSAYDQRWWVILYDPEQERTVKARLSNLESIQLLGPSGVPEEAVSRAMERLLEPEPVVLRVRRTRNALERCFLVFENQMFLETEQISEDCWRLSFQYYRFDRGEILRRLLYLGPGVTLLSPASLREELGELLERAVALAEEP